MANSVYDDQDTDALKGLEESFTRPSATESGSQKLAEQQALEDAYAAPDATESGSQKLADANQLRQQEDNAADDTVGNGYKSTTKKAKISKGWWNKKRAGIAGSILGMLGIGGIGGIGLFSGVVLQPLHLAETLLHPYSLQQSDTEDSQHHWLRDLRALKKNDARYTRVGAVGAKLADNLLSSFSDAGITFSGSDILGRPTSIEFDQDKITKLHPETEGMNSAEFDDWLNDQYGFEKGRISDGKLSLAGLKDQDISSIAKTSKNLAANDELLSGLGLRSLKRLWGVNSLFHPLSRALDNKLRAKATEVANKKQSGQKETPEEGTSSTDPAVSTTEESLNSELAPTTSSVTEAGSDIVDTASDGGRTAASWVTLGSGQLLTLGCTLNKGADDIITIDRIGTVLPAIAKVTQLIALASQIKAGGSEVTMAQIGGIMSGLKATTQSDKDNGTKDAGTTVWDGGALGVLAGTAIPDKNGAVPNDIQLGHKNAFNPPNVQKLKAVGSNITSAAFGYVPVPDKCGLVGTAVQLAAGITEQAGLLLANVEDGETATPAIETAIKLMAADFIKQLPQNIGMGVGESVAMKQIENIIKSGGAKQLAADAFTGAQGGDLLAYGARAAANLASAASGGIDIANSASQTILGSAGQEQEQQFQHESFFARTFDITDTRSLMGKLSMSITPSLSTNTYSLATGILNINNSLAHTFGSLLSRPTSAATSDSWTGSYDWGFDQVGIPSSLMNSDDNYSNAEDLGKYLSSVCTDGTTIGPDKGACDGDNGYTARIKACFGNDLLYTDNLWDVTPEQASSPTQPIDIDPASDAYINADCTNANNGGIVVCKNDNDTRASCIWGRVVLFVNDMHTLKLMDCADGTTDTSEQSCTDEGVSSGEAATTSTPSGNAPTTTAGNKLIFASYNMCDDHNHNNCPHTTGQDSDTTTKASLIAKVFTGQSSVNSRPIDIAAVQELSQKTEKNLMNDLGSSYQAFPSKVARNNSHAVIWNSSKFTMVGKGCLSEQVTGGTLMGNGNNEHLDGSANCSTDQSDRSNPAGFPWVQLQSTSGKSIYVMSVHLPNNCYGSLGIRSNDARQIYQYWVKPKLSSGAMVIVSGDWNWSGTVSCGNYWDGNNANATPEPAYCILTKNSDLQTAEDLANGKSGQCPTSSRLQIDQPFVSAGITASNYKHIDSNDAGTDHSPAIVKLMSESGF